MNHSSVEIFQAGRPTAEIPSELILQLHVTEKDSITELMIRTGGRDREEYALTALRIGLLSLRHARGQVDAEAVRREADRLVTKFNGLMENYRNQLNDQLTTTLKDY